MNVLGSEEKQVGKTHTGLSWKANGQSQNYGCTQGAAKIELKVLGSLGWQRTKLVLCTWAHGILWVTSQRQR